ncbi:MAG: hypothetical protein ACK5NG_00840 [Chthoniobacterales bacterium]
MSIQEKTSSQSRGICFFLMAILSLTLLPLTGCSTTDELGRSRETSIPWNRPAKWEGPGVLGSNMPQSY